MGQRERQIDVIPPHRRQRFEVMQAFVRPSIRPTPHRCFVKGVQCPSYVGPGAYSAMGPTIICNSDTGDGGFGEVTIHQANNCLIKKMSVHKTDLPPHE